jgi:23S rRNA pseudouridine1911/1915/1917 synthase
LLIIRQYKAVLHHQAGDPLLDGPAAYLARPRAQPASLTMTPMDFRTFEARAGERLDAAMAGAIDISRTTAKELIQEGYAQINGRPVSKASQRLAGGEIVSVMLPDQAKQPISAEEMEIDVIFMDQDLLAISKAPGVTVHPTATLRSGTLVNGLLTLTTLSREHLFDPLDDDYRPGIVHRLDKDTSGVMVVAKTDEAHQHLVNAFKRRLVEKEYLAVICGTIDDEVHVDAAIGRHPVKRQQMTVGGANPKSATTLLHVIARTPDESHSLVRVRPHTGRTHQIRVHLAYLHAPILGDAVYGRPSAHISRQALHASSLIVPHPHDNQALTFRAQAPADIKAAWRAVGGTWPESLD